MPSPSVPAVQTAITSAPCRPTGVQPIVATTVQLAVDSTQSVVTCITSVQCSSTEVQPASSDNVQNVVAEMPPTTAAVQTSGTAVQTAVSDTQRATATPDSLPDLLAPSPPTPAAVEAQQTAIKSSPATTTTSAPSSSSTAPASAQPLTIAPGGEATNHSSSWTTRAPTSTQNTFSSVTQAPTLIVQTLAALQQAVGYLHQLLELLQRQSGSVPQAHGAQDITSHSVDNRKVSVIPTVNSNRHRSSELNPFDYKAREFDYTRRDRHQPNTHVKENKDLHKSCNLSSQLHEAKDTTHHPCSQEPLDLTWNVSQNDMADGVAASMNERTDSPSQCAGHEERQPAQHYKLTTKIRLRYEGELQQSSGQTDSEKADDDSQSTSAHKRVPVSETSREHRQSDESLTFSHGETGPVKECGKRPKSEFVNYNKALSEGPQQITMKENDVRMSSHSDIDLIRSSGESETTHLDSNSIPFTHYRNELSVTTAGAAHSRTQLSPSVILSTRTSGLPINVRQQQRQLHIDASNTGQLVLSEEERMMILEVRARKKETPNIEASVKDNNIGAQNTSAEPTINIGPFKEYERRPIVSTIGRKESPLKTTQSDAHASTASGLCLQSTSLMTISPLEIHSANSNGRDPSTQTNSYTPELSNSQRQDAGTQTKSIIQRKRRRSGTSSEQTSSSSESVEYDATHETSVRTGPTQQRSRSPRKMPRRNSSLTHTHQPLPSVNLPCPLVTATSIEESVINHKDQPEISNALEMIQGGTASSHYNDSAISHTMIQKDPEISNPSDSTSATNSKAVVDMVAQHSLEAIHSNLQEDTHDKPEVMKEDPASPSGSLLGQDTHKYNSRFSKQRSLTSPLSEVSKCTPQTTCTISPAITAASTSITGPVPPLAASTSQLTTTTAHLIESTSRLTRSMSPMQTNASPLIATTQLTATSPQLTIPARTLTPTAQQFTPASQVTPSVPQLIKPAPQLITSAPPLVTTRAQRTTAESQLTTQAQLTTQTLSLNAAPLSSSQLPPPHLPTITPNLATTKSQMSTAQDGKDNNQCNQALVSMSASPTTMTSVKHVSGPALSHAVAATHPWPRADYSAALLRFEALRDKSWLSNQVEVTSCSADSKTLVHQEPRPTTHLASNKEDKYNADTLSSSIGNERELAAATDAKGPNTASTQPVARPPERIVKICEGPSARDKEVSCEDVCNESQSSTLSTSIKPYKETSEKIAEKQSKQQAYRNHGKPVSTAQQCESTDEPMYLNNPIRVTTSDMPQAVAMITQLSRVSPSATHVSSTNTTPRTSSALHQSALVEPARPSNHRLVISARSQRSSTVSKDPNIQSIGSSVTLGPSNVCRPSQNPSVSPARPRTGSCNKSPTPSGASAVLNTSPVVRTTPQRTTRAADSPSNWGKPAVFFSTQQEQAKTSDSPQISPTTSSVPLLRQSYSPKTSQMTRAVISDPQTSQGDVCSSPRPPAPPNTTPVRPQMPLRSSNTSTLLADASNIIMGMLVNSQNAFPTTNTNIPQRPRRPSASSQRFDVSINPCPLALAVSSSSVSHEAPSSIQLLTTLSDNIYQNPGRDLYIVQPTANSPHRPLTVLNLGNVVLRGTTPLVTLPSPSQTEPSAAHVTLPMLSSYHSLMGTSTGQPMLGTSSAHSMVRMSHLQSMVVASTAAHGQIPANVLTSAAVHMYNTATTESSSTTSAAVSKDIQHSVTTKSSHSDITALEVAGTSVRLSVGTTQRCSVYEASNMQGQKSIQNEASNVQGQQKSVQNEASNVHGQQKSVQNEASNVQGQKKSVQNEASNVQGQKKSVQNEASNVQGQKKSVQNEASNVQGQKKSVQNEASNVQGQKKRVQNEVSDVQGQKKSVQNETSNVQGRQRSADYEAKLAQLEKLTKQVWD